MDGSFSAEDTASRLAMHEAVCAERYGNLLLRLSRLEALMIGAVTAVIGAMGALVMTLIRAGFGG